MIRGAAAGVWFLLAAGAWAQDAIYFERVFPGAVPGHFEATLSADGKVSYAEEGAEAIEFEVSAGDVAPVFETAARLDYFNKPLASTRKVASTGRKRLRYLAAGTVRGEAEFDYSEIKDAREVASWFVKFSETQRHLADLERLYRFDRLGVNQALVFLEEAYERERIVAPELLVPVLGKIAQASRLMHMARARAEGLLERIRARSR